MRNISNQQRSKFRSIDRTNAIQISLFLKNLLLLKINKLLILSNYKIFNFILNLEEFLIIPNLKIFRNIDRIDTIQIFSFLKNLLPRKIKELLILFNYKIFNFTLNLKEYLITLNLKIFRNIDRIDSIQISLKKIFFFTKLINF